MFIQRRIVSVLILLHIIGTVATTSFDLVRYHANVYRCGEIILDEDLIRPLYSYFVVLTDDEYQRTNNLIPVLHALARIVKACRKAYLISQKEMRSPSTLYHGFKWFKSTFEP